MVPLPGLEPDSGCPSQEERPMLYRGCPAGGARPLLGRAPPARPCPLLSGGPDRISESPNLRAGGSEAPSCSETAPAVLLPAHSSPASTFLTRHPSPHFHPLYIILLFFFLLSSCHLLTSFIHLSFGMGPSVPHWDLSSWKSCCLVVLFSSCSLYLQTGSGTEEVLDIYESQ